MRILRGLQVGLGIADEAKAAMKHAVQMMEEEDSSYIQKTSFSPISKINEKGKQK